MNEDFINAFSLKGKVAIVTGGGSGLGLSMAKCMANSGAKVIITGHGSVDKLKKAVEEIPNASYFLIDVTKTEDSAKFVANIVKEFGSIDILVNNAGCHCKKPAEETSDQDFQNIFDVHVFGTMGLVRAVLPYMKKQREGSIINISSMSALVGLTNVVAYSAAKSAILGITKTLASEVSSYGINVNSIAPGFIDTPMFHKAVDGDIDRQNKILGHTPANNYGKPSDIGWAAVYLSSASASFITGTCLVVDGGFSIGF